MSARRSSSVSQKSDGKIMVYIHNLHSCDKLVLRVCPDLQIGSCSSSCSGVEGAGETTIQTSLKSEIASALGIDAMQIRLISHGTPLGDDEKTLKCYGIGEGDTVHLRVQRAPSAGRHDVVLACAAKKELVQAELDKTDMLCMRPYAMQPSSARARLNQRCVQSGASLMPKWVSQEHPKLFAPVGAGIDGHAGDTAYDEFSSLGVWIAPVDHPNQRGQNQYGVQRVREAIAAKRGSVGGA